MEPELREKLRHLPDKPGAYMMKDDRGDVIYVGKAASLRSRVRSYFRKGQAHPPKVLVMTSKVKDVDWLVTDTEVEALMLECNLIKKHRPHYNVRLRDDKHYPYLCVTTSEPFPRVLVVRRVKQDGNTYFGPYADSSALRESQRLIRRTFRIRSCNKKLVGGEQDRPCLNLHMKQCESPCSGRITRIEYAELVKDTCLFLEGRAESLAARLEREMASAADNLDFERAARLRDQIGAVRKLIERQKVISTDETDQDVISVLADGVSTCVQLLFVRSGKLVGQEHFFLEGAAEESAESSLSEFMKQYYQRATYVPGEVFVSHDPAEREIIERLLSLKRGSKVRLAHPRRGHKRRLVEMAAENAALAMARSGSGDEQEEAAKDLEALRQALGLPEAPARIEAYDISNVQGKEAVGSMVVFERGVPAKSRYRRFKIRTSDQPDDCAMMREVLTRRLAQVAAGDPKFAPLPDLILVDGGRGQLNAALEAVSSQRPAASSQPPAASSQQPGTRSQWPGASAETSAPEKPVTQGELPPRPQAGEGRGEGVTARERTALRQAQDESAGSQPSAISHQPFGIPVISLAKRLEEIYTPASAHPLLLPRESRALRLLQRIRDEAHRFALSYHHKLREKTVRKSVLDSIPGIGAQRRKALIRKFGSVAGVRRASLEELLCVPGMMRSTAQAVYEALHS